MPPIAGKRGIIIYALLATYTVGTCALAQSLGRDRVLTLEELEDKIRGGWAGKMVGVTYGAPTEFRYRQRINTTPRKWKPQELAGALDQDDLYVQMTFAGVMDRLGLDATTEQYGEAHRDSRYHLWHANLRARRLLRRGVKPPLSGRPNHNLHANEIGTQFEADFVGLMCPGQPRAAQRYADRFGHVIAYGDGVYAGVFVSAMEAAAFFEREPRRFVEAGLAAIPAGSRYAQMVRDVLAWSSRHSDWKETWELINVKYDRDDPCPEGALKPFNISAVLNGAYVLLGLLYGAGDFDKTIEIAMRAGQDSDCNPGTAGAVIGTMLGFRRIPSKWVEYLPRIADARFSHTDYTFNSIVRSTVERAKRVVELEGGRVEDRRLIVPVERPAEMPLEQFWAGNPAERLSLDDPRWGWIGPWSKSGKEDGYHGISLRSKTRGAEAKITFEGTGAVVVGALAPDCGLADVYLDGTFVETVDAYNEDDRYNEALWGRFDLKSGPHTVRVVVRGEAFPGSSDAWVYLEDLIVFRK